MNVADSRRTVEDLSEKYKLLESSLEATLSHLNQLYEDAKSFQQTQASGRSDDDTVSSKRIDKLEKDITWYRNKLQDQVRAANKMKQKKQKAENQKNLSQKWNKELFRKLDATSQGKIIDCEGEKDLVRQEERKRCKRELKKQNKQR